MPTTTAPRISPRYWLQARAMQAIYPRIANPRPELYLATREVAPHTEEHVTTRHGPVRVFIYQPPLGAPTPGGPDAPLPVYINLHGGGFFGRYPEQDHHIARYIASEVGAVVVSVDYDVVPQVSYPVPEHEVYDVTKWVHDVSASRGWDPDRIAAGGQSAGGKLALNVAQQTHDAGEFQLAGLVSLYGSADISRDDRTSPLQRPMVPHRVQNLVINTLGVDVSRRREALASPYYDDHLADKLPPTLIETGEYDTLGPSMDEIAARLAAAGVTVTHRRFDKTDHGFTHFGTPEVAAEAFTLLRDFLTGVFTTATPPADGRWLPYRGGSFCGSPGPRYATPLRGDLVTVSDL